MELFEHRCTHCGGELTASGDGAWICPYCGSTFDDDTAEKNAKTLRELLDESRLETVNNLRRNLYDAVNAEYLSSIDIQNLCVELKTYLPDDFRANFYLVASGINANRIAHYIRGINADEHYEHIGDAVKFLVRNLQSEFLLELNDLVDRAYKYRDLALYEKYVTLVADEAARIQSGVYETKLPREVFVAYSSKDMSRVIELVECFETQGLRCFVAARNLRHGRGAVENYDEALKEAMDHCRSFVFVSSMNSRSLSCDALEIEIPYVRSRDIENAPLEFRNNYVSIPSRYKKPRVELRIEESNRYNAADEIVGEFFDGYERVYSPEEAAGRVMKQLVSSSNAGNRKKDETKNKYCAKCGNENSQESKFCSACGNDVFVSSVSEFIKLKNQEGNTENNRADSGEQRIVVCKKCGGSNLIGRNGGACEYCNEPLRWPDDRKTSKYCVGCGSENAVNAYSCAKCGDTRFAASVEELLKAREEGKKNDSDAGKRIAEDIDHLVKDAEVGFKRFVKEAEAKINEVNGKIEQKTKEEFAKWNRAQRPGHNNFSGENPYARSSSYTDETGRASTQGTTRAEKKQGGHNATYPQKKTSKARPGWIVSFVILSLMTTVYLLISFIEKSMIYAFGGFGSLAVMSLIMMLSPKGCKNIFGMKKGIRKWIIILLGIVMFFVFVALSPEAA